MERCPHCGGTTTSEESRLLRRVCGACGGARIPGFAVGHATKARLARAKSELTKQRTGSLAGAAMVAMALLVAVVAIVAALMGHGGAAFGAATLSAIDFAIAVAAWGYARKRGAASRDSLDDAWADVAASIARSHGGQVTTRELAAALKTDEADADAILAKLSARGARVEIDDDAQLHYRVDPGVDSAVDADGVEAMSERANSPQTESPGRGAGQ